MPWHAVVTEARAEWGVAKALRDAGLEILYLHRPTTRRSRSSGRQIGVNVALYTRIVFARIDEAEAFHLVRACRNVRSIMQGKIREAEIEFERTRADASGKVAEPEPELAPMLAEGAEVMVIHGACAGFAGTVEIDTGAEIRLHVVLFGRRILATVPKTWVEIATTRTAAQTQNQRR